MADRAALFAAILANPADDAPRLAFADYLDAHGEKNRAEFIRAQIGIALLKPDDVSRLVANAVELDGRAAGLWRRGAWQWLAGFPGAELMRVDRAGADVVVRLGGKYHDVRYTTARGFVDGAFVPAVLWSVDFARQLLALTPLTALVIRGRDEAHGAERLAWARSLSEVIHA